jgi:hypothetical protein
MSFAAQIERILLGEGLRERLVTALAEQHASKRLEEVDQARRRALSRKKSRGEVFDDVLEEKKVAEERAIQSALTAENAEKRAAHANIIFKEAESELHIQQAALALASARTDAEDAYAKALLHQRTAEEALARALAAIPDEEVTHVGVTYDVLFEAAIDAAVVACLRLETFGVKAVKCQVGGHVEDPGTLGAPGFFGVHVWPVE